MDDNKEKIEKGFLYVANKQKFVREAMISAQSIRQFSSLPIAIVCSENLVNQEVSDFFDFVIPNEQIDAFIYLAKIVGIQNSPFNRTFFLDTDTFVCSDVSNLFELLDVVDICTTQESSYHTTNSINNIAFKNIIPEFNSGVIIIKKSEITKLVLQDWLTICIENNIKNDMPGLREAMLKNLNSIKYFVLPQEYNSHGYKSMLILYSDVKIIHERLGTSWKSITPFFLSFEENLKFAKKINKISHKRLYLPEIGVLPYNYNLYNIILKLKKIVNVKRMSKNQ